MAVDYISGLSYIGIFFVVLTAGYVIPIPEEIIVLALGYLGAIGVLNPWMAAGIIVLALMVGDLAVYLLARHGFPRATVLYTRLTKSWFGKRFKITSDEELLRHIFLFRFIPGLRFVSPLMAGMHKISWVKFFGIDLLAITLYACVYVFLGYQLSDSFLKVALRVEEMRHAVFTVLLIVLGGIIIAWAYRVLKRLDEEAVDAKG